MYPSRCCGYLSPTCSSVELNKASCLVHITSLLTFFTLAWVGVPSGQTFSLRLMKLKPEYLKIHTHTHAHTHTQTLVATEMGLFSMRQGFSPSSSSSSFSSSSTITTLVSLFRQKIRGLHLTRHLLRVYISTFLARVNGVKINKFNNIKIILLYIQRNLALGKIIMVTKI